MRVKNKEIRARRHRKEQQQKAEARELRAKYGTADKTAAAPKKAPAAKPAAKKAETGAKAAAPKKPAATKAKKAEAKEE